jgi:uncharacterized RDD family membrane protein YckC
LLYFIFQALGKNDVFIGFLLYAVLFRRKDSCCMEAGPVYYPQSQAKPQLEYAGNYAGVGMRFLALLIDSILLGVAGGILLVFFRLLLGSTAGTTVASLVGSVVGIVYCIGLEATQGATLGKKMLSLRVVKTDGFPIGWPEAFIRYLLRIVDLMLVIPIGAILIWITPQHQRLGDFVAHTIVISNRC